MRIAQVCPRYYPHIGGVETHVEEISKRLVKRDCKIRILTTDPSGKLPKIEIINDVKVIRFKSWAPNEAYYFSGELKKYLMKNSDSFDIVHAHNYQAFPALYAAQVKGRNKLMFSPHYHGAGHTFFRNLLHKPYKFLGKKILEKADKIVCVSNYERSLVIKRFKVDEKKVVVIPNGINLEEFRGLKKQSKNKNCRVILYVSRLEKYKGVHFLIKALPKLNSNVVFEVVGKGPYKRVLVELARKQGVRDRVKFYQDLSRKELLQKYVDADLFVLLSKYEAYGITVAEALASGTPCIVANASALEEWVDNESCFGISYPISTKELSELVERVIGKQIEGLKLPSWNEVVNRLAKLYEEC